MHPRALEYLCLSSHNAWISLSGPMQHFTQAELPCVVAYVTIFSLMLLQKYNKLSLIQSLCPNEVNYFSYINNVVNLKKDYITSHFLAFFIRILQKQNVKKMTSGFYRGYTLQEFFTLVNMNRPAPVELCHKNMRFLITHNPTDGTLSSFIEVRNICEYVCPARVDNTIMTSIIKLGYYLHACFPLWCQLVYCDFKKSFFPHFTTSRTWSDMVPQ